MDLFLNKSEMETLGFSLLFKYLIAFSIAICERVKPKSHKECCQKPILVIFSIYDPPEKSLNNF